MPAHTKPPGQRVRRNLDQKQWRTLPADGRDDPAPELPGERWLDRTVSWWQTIWASPMATVWEEADIESLVRLAELKDQFARGDAPAAALTAIQQLEDRFGLNPRARQQLMWQIGDRSSSAEQNRPAATVTRLRAVDPRAASA